MIKRNTEICRTVDTHSIMMMINNGIAVIMKSLSKAYDGYSEILCSLFLVRKFYRPLYMPIFLPCRYLPSQEPPNISDDAGNFVDHHIDIDLSEVGGSHDSLEVTQLNYGDRITSRTRKGESTDRCSSYQSSRTYTCVVCSEVFDSSQDLGRHMLKHSDVHLVCELCSKTFRQYSVLRRHHREVHLSQRPFICHICKKGFARNSDLKRHFEGCSRAFASSMAVEETRIVCQMCNKTFRTKHLLVRHHREVHLLERPFSCQVCAKGFARRSDLKRHHRARHPQTTFS